MHRIAGVTGLLLAMAMPAVAQDGVAPEDPPFTMNLGARLQVRYTHDIPGAEGVDPLGSFGIRRGRLSVGGTAYQRFTYALQLELAGQNVQLIDASIGTTLAPMARVAVGQGKAPFGRQQLTSSGSLQMVDRAITDGRFAPGRQVGMTLSGQNQARTFEYGAGIYNGHGPRVPNDNGRFMVAGRAVFTPLGAYPLGETALDYPAEPRIALGAAVMHNTLGTADTETDLLRLGLEGAFKLRGITITGELFREQATPAVGDRMDTHGAYLQAGYLLPGRRHEVAARWALISPDADAANDQRELGVGHSFYLNGHRAKIQTDLRRIDRDIVEWSDWQLRVQLQLTM